MLRKGDCAGRHSADCEPVYSMTCEGQEGSLFEPLMFSNLRRRRLFWVELLQLRIFRFCGDEDRNIRVRIFPEREKILIRRWLWWRSPCIA